METIDAMIREAYRRGYTDRSEEHDFDPGRALDLLSDEPPSYHDLFVTTKDIPRTSIFNLPFGAEVTCNRVGGWCLWDTSKSDPPHYKGWRLIAGEYDKGLRLDVNGVVICDSLTRQSVNQR